MSSGTVQFDADGGIVSHTMRMPRPTFQSKQPWAKFRRRWRWVRFDRMNRAYPDNLILFNENRLVSSMGWEDWIGGA